jgi:hypothetical protein
MRAQLKGGGGRYFVTPTGEGRSQRHRPLRPADGVLLGGMLKHRTCLHLLDLSNSGICGVDANGKGTHDSTGIKAIMKGLSASPYTNRVSVNLASTWMGIDGAVAVSKLLLQTNPQLKIVRLELRRCFLRPEGCLVIGKALLDQRGGMQLLRALGVAENGLTWNGRDNSGLAALLAGLLRPDSGVSALDLRDNDLSFLLNCNVRRKCAAAGVERLLIEHVAEGAEDAAKKNSNTGFMEIEQFDALVKVGFAPRPAAAELPCCKLAPLDLTTSPALTSHTLYVALRLLPNRRRTS